MAPTAVLAYSGGLDTSCAIAWLKEDYGFDEVVAVLVDVGQDADFEPAIARGYAAGATEVVLVDRKDAFADEQVAKALLANALYEGKYPLLSALSRPVIADAVAGIAEELGAEAVVHGCTGKGNDQLRFELAFKARYPGAEVIASLNALAGPYGIGRIDMIENRAVGIKSRELYEAPAAMTLIEAHGALEDLVLTKAELDLKRELSAKWAQLVYEGLWFSPVREAIDSFVATTQQLVTGEVRVRLAAGAATVT